MPTSLSRIPAGFHTATPYIVVADAEAAVTFYRRAFDATEIMRHTDDTGASATPRSVSATHRS